MANDRKVAKTKMVMSMMGKPKTKFIALIRVDKLNKKRISINKRVLAASPFYDIRLHCLLIIQLNKEMDGKNV